MSSEGSFNGFYNVHSPKGCHTLLHPMLETLTPIRSFNLGPLTLSPTERVQSTDIVECRVSTLGITLTT